jgi:hypothetical protein
MNLLKDIAAYWKETWEENKLVFFLELFGTAMGMTASALLNFFAASNPPMLTILLLYGVSAAMLAYTSFKRHSSFMVLLMLFYTIVSCVGLFNILA